MNPVALPDIAARITADFGTHAAEAGSMLKHAMINAEHLADARIIRCIVFLAKGDLKKLRKMIESAISDPRDVMFWAENIYHAQPEKTQRVRDFSEPFDTISRHDTNDELIPFNHAIWKSWKLQGYRYIRYRRIDENAVALKPFFVINSSQDAEEMYTYFSIDDDEVCEWADNNDPLLADFEFLVES